MNEIEALLAMGLYPYGDVKTHTSRTPVKELIEAVGPNSGDWAVFTTTVAGGHPVYAIGHRRGGTVHTYLSSHGQTLVGTPQSHKDDIASLGCLAKPRPCPKILNDWTAMQPVIDKQNRWRQAELAMEKRFVTTNFSLRLLTTILGMTLGNAHAAFARFVGPVGTFLETVNDIAYDGMHNTEDAPAAPEVGAAAEDLTPGSCSPTRASPTRVAAQHKLGPLRLLPGFKGNKQQGCSVCGVACSLCCSFCSTADLVVALCDPTKRGCLADHKANPTSDDHKRRRPSGRRPSGTGPSKAARKKASAVPAVPAKKGSRSGASASFDQQDFLRRVREEVDSEEEEEDAGEEEDDEEEDSDSD